MARRSTTRLQHQEVCTLGGPIMLQEPAAFPFASPAHNRQCGRTERRSRTANHTSRQHSFCTCQATSMASRVMTNHPSSHGTVGAIGLRIQAFAGSEHRLVIVSAVALGSDEALSRPKIDPGLFIATVRRIVRGSVARTTRRLAGSSRSCGACSLLADDCEAYRDFLNAPSPALVGPRQLRSSVRWRPFAASELSAEGQRYAVRALRAAFAWLVDVRYLAGNPWTAVSDPVIVERENLLKSQARPARRSMGADPRPYR